MAIINCPACGKSVSDKGKDCIHCGSLLSVQNGQNSLNDELTCPECGASMPKANERCEVCGCPLHNDSAKKPKKEKVKKEKVKKEKPPKKVLSPKEKLEKERRVFNTCSIVALVMSEFLLVVAIVVPIIATVVTINHNTESFNFLYFKGICFESGYILGYNGFWYRDETKIVLAIVIPLVCRFCFIVARKIFKEKALKAERELEKYIDEEK